MRDGTHCHVGELDVVSIGRDVEQLLEQLSDGSAQLSIDIRVQTPDGNDLAICGGLLSPPANQLVIS